MNPLFLNPWFLAACGAVVFVSAGLGYLKGYTSQADEVATCEAKVGTVKGIQHELEQAAEEQRLLSERASADAQEQYRVAADYWHSHPRIVRVLPAGNDLCSGQAGAIPNFTGKLGATSSEPGLRADVALTITDAEQRLNWCAEDAGKLILIQEWIKQQHEASK